METGMNDVQVVSVFGLGKVGVTLAAALLGAGYRVIGVDVSDALVKSFDDRSFTTEEPGVMEQLSGAGDRFKATLSSDEAVVGSQFSFVIVPTPSNTLSGFSNRFIIEVLKAIGAAAAQKSGRHTVSVVSTVMPGSSQSDLIPALEKAFGGKVGERLGYAYNPSFIAQGEVMKGIVTPEYAIIGESDETTGAIVEGVHRRMIQNDAPIVRLTTMEAEITKLASNTHETMRVAFANMLLAVCHEAPDANVDKITGALGYRLGTRFFKGAVPYGGPCWPRDNKALAAFMNLVGVPSTLPNAIDQANDYHGRYVLRQVLDTVPRGGSVGLIGLTYKPGTSMIDHSYGIDLAGWLASEGRTVVGWDPRGAREAKAELGERVLIAGRAEDCLACDAAVILLPLAEVKSIDWTAAAGAIVIDCWRVLTPEQQAQVGRYLPMGSGRTLADLPQLNIGTDRFALLVN
jgi:UDPglucose 6-dehydrogenase